MVERSGINVYQHVEKKNRPYVPVCPAKTGQWIARLLSRVLTSLLRYLSESCRSICLSTELIPFHLVLVREPRYGAHRRRTWFRFRGAGETALAAERRAIAKRFEIEQYRRPVRIVRGVYLNLDVTGRT